MQATFWILDLSPQGEYSLGRSRFFALSGSGAGDRKFLVTTGFEQIARVAHVITASARMRADPHIVEHRKAVEEREIPIGAPDAGIDNSVRRARKDRRSM
jgi:hypothetical protein